jgi:hypothetical protein
MTTQRKTIANRQNAKLSSGPRTTIGKARSSRNRRTHGLSVPIMYERTWEQKIEALTAAIAGARAQPADLKHARSIAAAEVELIRAQAARTDVLKAMAAVCDSMRPDDEATSAASFDIVAGIIAALRRLKLFDRYVRRARSRRNRAVRSFVASDAHRTSF